MIEILTMNLNKLTNFKNISYLVIDEGDRMFDLGFEP